jgi:hypothetical protein
LHACRSTLEDPHEADIKDLKTLVETPIEKIAELTKLSLEEVEKIVEKAKKEIGA